MRILVLATDAYGGHGGIALFNRELTATLTTYPGVDEVVVVPRVMPHPGEHEIPAKVRFVAEAANGNVAYARAILRHVRGKRFDLVICGHINLLPLARDPLLVTHGIEAWKRSKNERLVHRCRGVISVSELTRNRFVECSKYAGPTYVLPNAVRREHYGMHAKNTRYGLEGKRVLLTVGRVVAEERYKGFDEVIEILPKLSNDVVYMIAGGGNDIERLREKAAALGVADRVIFTGRFAEEEKRDLYNLADVYVMPSRGEGFGFVFLEAVACGVPVIASKHDGGREAILNGELGLLIDPSSSAEIEAAIRELLARGTKTIPERLDYFSFENFERRVHAILDQSLASGPVRPLVAG